MLGLRGAVKSRPRLWQHWRDRECGVDLGYHLLASLGIFLVLGSEIPEYVLLGREIGGTVERYPSERCSRRRLSSPMKLERRVAAVIGTDFAPICLSLQPLVSRAQCIVQS